MLKIKVSEIPQNIYKKIFLKKDFYIKSISIDSRTIKKGEVFVALKGERFDGHHFIKEALKKGASLIVCEEDFYKKNKESFKDFNYLICKSTLKFLTDFAHFIRKKHDKVKVIGITGSCGKTTTKEIIGTILSKKFNTVFSKDSYNNFIGLPLTVFRLTPFTEYLVLEIGTNKKGEIYKLSKLALPDFSLITNIGPSHLEFFKTIKNVYLEKIKILRFTKEKVFLNNDDKFLRNVNFKKKTTFALKNKADFEAIIKEKTDHYIKFYVPQLKETFTIKSAFLHNVYNSLAGISLLVSLGLEVGFIKKKLKEFTFPKMRVELINKNGILIINDAYNSNPLSLSSVLKDLDSFKNKRKILVLADMLELGKKAKYYHYKIAELLKKCDFEYLLCWGRYSKFLFDRIKDFKKNCEYFEEKSKMIKKLKKILRKGDLLLIKGSRRTRLEEILEKI